MHSRNSCKTLKCPRCNWHYKYQETLEIHMKEKHPENELNCLYCLTNQTHPRLARGETYTCGYKPYRCELCNYSTTTKGNLSIHMTSDKHMTNIQQYDASSAANKLAANVVAAVAQQQQQQHQAAVTTSNNNNLIIQNNNNNDSNASPPITNNFNTTTSTSPTNSSHNTISSPINTSGGINNINDSSRSPIGSSTAAIATTTAAAAVAAAAAAAAAAVGPINLSSSSSSTTTTTASNNKKRAKQTSSSKYLDPNRPFKCDICKESFTQKSILLVHNNSVSHLNKLRQNKKAADHQGDQLNNDLHLHQQQQQQQQLNQQQNSPLPMQQHLQQPQQPAANAQQQQQQLLHALASQFGLMQQLQQPQPPPLLPTINPQQQLLHALASQFGLIQQLQQPQPPPLLPTLNPQTQLLHALASQFGLMQQLQQQPPLTPTSTSQQLEALVSQTNSLQQQQQQLQNQHQQSSTPRPSSTLNHPQQLDSPLLQGASMQQHQQQQPQSQASSLQQQQQPTSQMSQDADSAAAAAAAAAAALTAQQQKRARTRISEDQLRILRQYFDINNSPTEDQLREMSIKSELPLKVIKHWFRNTLFKERQKNKDSPYNFNNPPMLALNLEEYERTGEAKVTPISDLANNSQSSINGFVSSTIINRTDEQQQQQPFSHQKQQEQQLNKLQDNLNDVKPRLDRLIEKLTNNSNNNIANQTNNNNNTNKNANTTSNTIENRLQLTKKDPIEPTKQENEQQHHESGDESIEASAAAIVQEVVTSVSSAKKAEPQPRRLTSSPPISDENAGIGPSSTWSPLQLQQQLFDQTWATVNNHLKNQGLSSKTSDSSSHSVNSSSTNSKSKRANRTRFSDRQVKVLQEFFETNAYPKDDDLECLSKQLGLSPRVIVVWFQNARQKARKVYENRPNSASLSEADDEMLGYNDLATLMQRHQQHRNHQQKGMLMDSFNDGESSMGSAQSPNEGSTMGDFQLHQRTRSCTPSEQQPHQPQQQQDQQQQQQQQLEKMLMNHLSEQNDKSDRGEDYEMDDIDDERDADDLMNETNGESDEENQRHHLDEDGDGGHDDLEHQGNDDDLGDEEEDDVEFMSAAQMLRHQQQQQQQQLAAALFGGDASNLLALIAANQQKQQQQQQQQQVEAENLLGGGVDLHQRYMLDVLGSAMRGAVQNVQSNGLVGLASGGNSSLSGHLNDSNAQATSLVCGPVSQSGTPLSETSRTTSHSTPSVGCTNGLNTTANSSSTTTNSASQRDKRLRTQISPEQLDYLYQKYQIESNPSRKTLESIAQDVGLSKRVVQVWFQNTRARERRGQLRMSHVVAQQRHMHTAQITDHKFS